MIGLDLLTMRVQRRVRCLMSGGSSSISLLEQSSSTCIKHMTVSVLGFQGEGSGEVRARGGVREPRGIRVSGLRVRG